MATQYLPVSSLASSMWNRRQLLRGACGLGLGALQACTLSRPASAPARLVQHLRDLHEVSREEPMDALLLGEQHDAPEHQALHQAVIEAWCLAHDVSAVVLEMADAGQDTRGLSPQASAAQVQARLAWSDSAWPWAAYGPAVMTAVAHGVPVIGGNLPRQRHREVMRDAAWDARVSPQARQALEDAVREGHCHLLPESQLRPMTRIQIARDARMADTLVAAHQNDPRTVILLCGVQHAHRQQGVRAHLPTSLRCHSVALTTGKDDASAAYDTVWHTAPVPEQDHCAHLKQQLQPQ